MQGIALHCIAMQYNESLRSTVRVCASLFPCTRHSTTDLTYKTATVLTATAVSGVVGGPLASAMLSLNGFLGLRGWQWLFLLEALPTVVLAYYIFHYLPRGVSDSRHFTSEETRMIERQKKVSGQGLLLLFFFSSFRNKTGKKVSLSLSLSHTHTKANVRACSKCSEARRRRRRGERASCRSG